MSTAPPAAPPGSPAASRASLSETQPADRVVLAAGLWAQLDARVSAVYPEEACGLLLGTRASRTIRIERLCPSRNVAPGDRRVTCELEPGAIVAAEDEARRLRRSVVGTWHSHPERPPLPSLADRAGELPALGGQLLVRASCSGAGQARFWDLRGAQMLEIPLDARPGP